MESQILLQNFILKDQYKNDFVLKSYTGKIVLLSFHPLAWTNICAEQMKALETNMDEFEKQGIIPFGISIDTIPSKLAWADSLSIKKLRMLSDFWPHGSVSKQFGIFREKEGFSERANLIIDGGQRLLWKKVYSISELPDLAEIFTVLSTLKY